MKKRPRLAVTLGDPAGIGPEIVLHALQDASLNRDVDLIAVGSRLALERAGLVAGAGCGLPDDSPGSSGPVLSPIDGGALPPYGMISADGGRHAGLALEAAVKLVKQGRADALVTAPLGKAALQSAGYAHAGHTPFLAEMDDAEEVFMLFVASNMSVVLVTDHIPLSQVPAALTIERIVAATCLAAAFVRTCQVHSPRIALAGLNPHAGEGGMLGSEEQSIMIPAAEQIREKGWSIEGPFPADTLYRRAAEGEFDLIVSPYHDQGLVAIKTHGLGAAIHYTLGLSFIRASVDHGTAYDIAGRGCADPEPLIRAIRGAMQQVQSRCS